MFDRFYIFATERFEFDIYHFNKQVCVGIIFIIDAESLLVLSLLLFVWGLNIINIFVYFFSMKS